MTEDQKKVILDYATELQTNDTPWRDFKMLCGDLVWRECTSAVNPLTMVNVFGNTFERKTRTITVTMPVPIDVEQAMGWLTSLYVCFNTEADCVSALVAIREAMGMQE